MTAITFDTLRLAQRLRDEAKFSPEQAERTASVLAGTFGDWQDSQQLATKADLREAEGRLETKIAEIKTDLIKWVVGIGFAQMTLMFAMTKLHG